jgi:CheY-like chemotaxis protein
MCEKLAHFGYFGYLGQSCLGITMQNCMELRSLLLCREPDTVRIFRRALCDLAIDVEVLTAASAVLQLLDRSRFDVVIVDCDEVAGGADVLMAIRESPSNKRATTIAVINRATNLQAAFNMGARFALDKPITLERASRALRAAYSFMVTELLRYFRHAVDTTAYLSFGGIKQHACKLTNVSDGGMAVAVSEQISPGAAVDVSFELPGVSGWLQVKGECAWSDRNSKIGIRFIYVPADTKRWLRKWIAEQVEEIDTDAAADKPHVLDRKRWLRKWLSERIEETDTRLQRPPLGRNLKPLHT